MPRKSFAFNLERSKISLLPSGETKTKILPRAMAQVVFNNVFFEFEGEQQKPYMVFEGEIEAYSIMKRDKNADFFNKVKRVVFAPENRPAGVWRYDFNDSQISEIAASGWFSYGSNIPSEFLSNRFALIVDNIQVDILNPDAKKGEAPILKVGPADNHMYKFSADDYNLTGFIIDNIRIPQDEFEIILDAEAGERDKDALRAAEVRREGSIKELKPLTEQQLSIRNAVMNAEIYAKEIWDEIDAYRVAHSSEYKREMDALKTKNAASVSSKSSDEQASEKREKTGGDATAGLSNFLSQFAPADEKKAASSEDAVTVKSSGDKKDVWAAFTQSAEDIRARNETEIKKNRADDAAQAVQAEIAQGTGSEIIEARNDAAVQKDRADNATQAAQQDISAEAIKERNENAAQENKNDDAAQAAQVKAVNDKINDAAERSSVDRYEGASESNNWRQSHESESKSELRKSGVEMGD